jgi:capsule biosynthesis phosphatase
MNIVIPLGGIGNRFKTQGYDNPKPLICALTKPIIRWVIDNLNLEMCQLYILYNNVLLKYEFEKLFVQWYPNLQHNVTFKCLDKQTLGAAETIHIACSLIDNDHQVVCIDGDTFYTIDILSKLPNENCVVYFNDYENYESPPYSYLTLNDNKITKIAEKEKISHNAVSGIYAFKSKHLILDNFEQFKQTCDSELYTSKFISYLLPNYEFTGICVHNDDVHNLGSPLHLQIFCNNYPIRSLMNARKIDPKRICFDLDNTLVTYPVIPGDYSTVNPISKNINVCNQLKKMGHTIIIHTARRMKTHNGNVGKVTADIASITINSLNQLNIQYDELYFGKPYADYYIDDKAVSAYTDLEKQLGCYTQISPRHFNSCDVGTYKTIIKKSESSLAGEIYYYQNIPEDIKDMFPIFFRSVSYYQYEIEHIPGVSLSKILINDTNFLVSIIPEVINSLNRIHSATSSESFDLHIKHNYLCKIQNRFHKYEHVYMSLGHYISEIQQYILSYFQREFPYKECVIHGDPVFSNILINKFGKFKFIDMRGQLGDTLSIRGDKYYDYAKLYQSIIGYDYILNDCDLNIHSIKRMELKFVTNLNLSDSVFTHIKHITLSLLMTLLPLHNDNEKILKYANLAYSLYLELTTIK